MRRLPATVASAALAVLLLVACGGGGTDPDTDANADPGPSSGATPTGEPSGSAAPTEELSPEEAAAAATFVSAGYNGGQLTVYVSGDGTEWTVVSELESMGDVYLATGGGRILMFAPGQGRPGPMRASDDNGLTWQDLPTPPVNIVSIGYVDGAFVGMADRKAYRSVDGSSWEQVHDFGGYGANIFQGTDTLVTFPQVPVSVPTFMSSTDGVAWTEGTLDVQGATSEFALRTATYAHDGSSWWAVDEQAKVWSSADGSSWEELATMPASSPARGLAIADGTFVAVLTQGRVYVSQDGLQWDDPVSRPIGAQDVEPLRS